MDTLELLRTFREVASRGSFSRAALSLDVSKANVSKYVAELETKLGVRLFNRTTRTVSLTDAGNLLLARSTPLVEMIELTQAELAHRARQPSGRLRLTAPHGLSHTVLPELLAEFLTRYPEVSISLDLNNRVIDMVDEGIDVALRVGRLTDANFIVRKLRRVEFAVCASPAYWNENGRPAQPEDLADHDALAYSLQGAAQWRFEIDGQTVGVDLRSRFEATDAAPLVGMALRSLGVVYLPQLMIQPQLDSGALEAVLQDFMPRDVWLYAAYAQRRHNSAALKALLAFLEERWKED